MGIHIRFVQRTAFEGEMKTEYVDIKKLKHLIDTDKISYNGDLNITNGMAILGLNLIYINKGSSCWKLMNLISPELIAEQIAKAIVHETIHHYLYNEKIADETLLADEEYMCKRMAGQIM